PRLHIIVADDSKTPTPRQDVEYHSLPFDGGISFGRNFLVSKVRTEFLVLLDDDHVFTRRTDLGAMMTRLKTKSIDIIAGDYFDFGRKRKKLFGRFLFRQGNLEIQIGKKSAV